MAKTKKNSFALQCLILIQFLFNCEVIVAQKVSRKILEKNEWYCSADLSADSTITLYSNKVQFESSNKTTCPFYTWCFKKHILFYISKNESCKGEPPEGIQIKTFVNSRYEISNELVWTSLIIRLNENAVIFSVESLQNSSSSESTLIKLIPIKPPIEIF